MNEFNNFIDDLETRVWCWVRFLVAVFAVLAVVWLASGCDRLTERAIDQRHIVMDCEMTTPEGSVMRCNHDLRKDIDESGDQINVKHPGSSM